jgi:hypothetical protein
LVVGKQVDFAGDEEDKAFGSEVGRFESQNGVGIIDGETAGIDVMGTGLVGGFPDFFGNVLSEIVGREFAVVGLSEFKECDAEMLEVAFAHGFLGGIIEAISAALFSPCAGCEDFSNAGNHGEDEQHEKTEQGGETKRAPIVEPREKVKSFGGVVPHQLEEESAEEQKKEEEGEFLKSEAINVAQGETGHARVT